MFEGLTAVDADEINGFIYWVEFGIFKRARLNGSNPEVIGKAGKWKFE